MDNLLISNSDYEKEIKFLSTLPYRNSPYSARNWGHVRHGLCSYSSKIKPSIAYYLVNLFSKPNDVILDPFSGVGTIPFEACLNHRKGIGVDLSPLAFHVTNAKVHKINKTKVNEEIQRVKGAISKSENIEIIDCEAKLFYHPFTFCEILAARDYFLNSEITPERSFVLSCLLHILHGNRPYALSRRSHNLIPIPPKGKFVYKPLMKSLVEKTDRMLNEELPPEFIEGAAYNNDACKMAVESVDKIFTSPPFLGTTEFLRQNRIRLWFCGWDKDKLIALKKNSNFLEFNGLSLYPQIFKEFHKILREDGLLILHLGIYKKENMAESLLPIAEGKNFTFLGLVNEDSTHIETHGRTDKGGTHTHQFLIMQKTI
jgi:DNA modification methylase